MASRDDVATGATTAVQSTPAPQEEEEAEGSPSLTGKPRACANKTLPEQFFAFNPEFLDDADKWSYRDLQGLAKQLGVPGGGKGSRAALVKKLKDWNRENDEALEEDPERWPQQASNFNLLPVDIGVKHAQATGDLPAGLTVEVPQSLQEDAEAHISPLLPHSRSAKRKRAGAGNHGSRSLLRKKSKYSPGGSQIHANTPPEDEEKGSKESPSIQFSPFNRVNLIPAKEEYDEYKAQLDPDVKQLF